jgi:hypothetical protein
VAHHVAVNFDIKPGLHRQSPKQLSYRISRLTLPRSATKIYLPWGSISVSSLSKVISSSIMHWINWYTSMCLNRMLKRTAHFWEKRYHSSGFEKSDYQRAKNTLRWRSLRKEETWLSKDTTKQ